MANIHELRQPSQSRRFHWYRPFKRLFDIATSTFGLCLCAPFFFVVAAAIKISDSGSVFFKQKRVGLNGQVFEIYKFRTMVEDAEDQLKSDPELMRAYEEQFKLGESDPRITRIGRFLRRTSIDELPNLINVFKGELSMIGPRPLPPDEVSTYFGGFDSKLLSIKPGITGYWQVYGRSTIKYPERVDFQLYYVDHVSPWLDFKILCKTIPAVIQKTGAE